VRIFPRYQHQAQLKHKLFRQNILRLSRQIFRCRSMKCQGDVAGNWDFFKQQWSDYEIATGLDKRNESVRLATLRSAMGRECLQILLNLSLPDEDKKKIDKCLEALENYFKRPETSCTSGMFLTRVCSQAKNPFKLRSQD